jgi:hypothetical protein
MRRFRTQDIATVESDARMGVFALRCPMCQSHRLVVAVRRRGGLATYSTDLDREEWTYYRHAPPISTDDVILIARHMQTYEGDLSDVLEDPLLGQEPD